MKKRFIAIVLACTMVFTTTCAFAAETSGNEYSREEYTIIVDNMGNQYKLISYTTDKEVTAVQTTMEGKLVAKSVLNRVTGQIENTVANSSSAVMMNTTENGVDTYSKFTTHISDYIVDEGTEISTRATRSFDSDFYDRDYQYQGTGKTDYVYNGNILTGMCYDRATGYYTEENRMSFKFARNTLLTIVVTGFSGVISGAGKITAAVLAGKLLSDFGISAAQDAIQSDFNPIVSIRKYDLKFKTTMKPGTSSTYIDMCIIDRTIDYVYSTFNGHVNREYVDMPGYMTAADVVWGGCMETVGYAGAAFAAKYITLQRPNLKIPVSGNQYTWEDA